jgi:hypothetical protein
MHSSLQSAAFYALPFACEILEGLLLWRLCRNRTFGRYPFLSAFICFDFVRTPLLLLVHHSWQGLFPAVYWTTDVPAQLLHFLILWDVARSLFRPNSTLRRIAWNTLLAAQAFLLPAIIFLCWSQASLVQFPSKSVPSVFEQYSSLAQAVLLLTIAGVARYYRISFGRNMRGLVFSLGPYLLLDSVSFASFQLFGDLRPFLELLPGAAFTAMIAVWLWAFWQFAPSPQVAMARQPDLFSKHQWNSIWQTTLGAVRRRSS